MKPCAAKYLIIISSIICFLLILPVLAQASDHLADEKLTSWNQLNTLAEETLFLVRKEEFEAARKRINQLSTSILQLEIIEHVQSIEQAQVILATLVDAKQALTAITINPQQVERQVLRMRLTLDAVSHKQQPLWLHYYTRISQQLFEAETALEQENRDQFHNRLNLLAAEYEMIRPAIIISHGTKLAVQIDSLLNFMLNNRAELWNNKQQATQQLKQLEQFFKKAFYQHNEELMNSFLLLLMAFTVLICSVLSYVGWRKYQAEHEQKTVTWRRARNV
jgi:sporulation protein YpjB